MDWKDSTSGPKQNDNPILWVEYCTQGSNVQQAPSEHVECRLWHNRAVCDSLGDVISVFLSILFRWIFPFLLNMIIVRLFYLVYVLLLVCTIIAYCQETTKGKRPGSRKQQKTQSQKSQKNHKSQEARYAT